MTATEQELHNLVRKFVDLDIQLKNSKKNITEQLSELKKKHDKQVQSIRSDFDIVEEEKSTIEESIKEILIANGQDSIQINGGFIKLNTKEKIKPLKAVDKEQLLLEFFGESKAKEFHDFITAHSNKEIVTSLTRVKKLK